MTTPRSDEVLTAFTAWVERQKPGRAPKAVDALDDAVAALDDTVGLLAAAGADAMVQVRESEVRLDTLQAAMESGRLQIVHYTGEVTGCES